MRGRNRNTWILLLLLAVGVVIGGLLGELFKEHISILGYSKPIGFQPFTINLEVMKFTLGMMVNFNLASIVGIILAIFVFSRL
ncbi:DUF4321 domain-containing protein [Marinisporobacter balticus]|uniref:Uncharacterized protein DUF4321 n=1 Tax=Marinisporobacter balticus TaxID=2018667 RepID=A0A4R2L793_9FIRM|nr:DUF4321 domain-containing protein [Marinisporobacter balticus]TCO79989.1 uncharacterized protein DUF4321 [Marinisporobacter balticus]